MTTAKRPYINKAFNQYVDDECLRYRSVPMAVVDTILKVKHPVNDYTGIKRVFNNIPARPININALATSIARMGGMDYSKVESIAMKIAEEEISAVKKFVKGNKDPFEVPTIAKGTFDYQPSNFSTYSEGAKSYYEKTFGPGGPGGLSSFGPGGLAYFEKTFGTKELIGEKREASLLLGDEAQSYNTPGFSNPGPLVSITRGGPPRPTLFLTQGESRSRAESGSSTLDSRERMRRGDDPRLTELYRNPQFISETSGINPFVNERNLERNLYVVGREPVSQVHHSNRDSTFGERYTKE